MRKKLLPVLLTLALAVALLTVGALAATPTVTTEATLQDGVNIVTAGATDTVYNVDEGKVLVLDGGTEETPIVFNNCTFNLSGTTMYFNNSGVGNTGESRAKLAIGSYITFNNCIIIAENGRCNILPSLNGDNEPIWSLSGNDACIAFFEPGVVFNGGTISANDWTGQFMGLYGYSAQNINAEVTFVGTNISTTGNTGGWSYAMYAGSVLRLTNNANMSATGMQRYSGVWEYDGYESRQLTGGNVNAFYSGDNRTNYNAIFIDNSTVNFSDNYGGGFAINNVNIHVNESDIYVNNNLGNACNSGYWIVDNSTIQMNGNRGGHALSCIGFEMTDSTLEILHNGYAGVYLQSRDSSLTNCTVDIRCNGERLLSYTAGDVWLQGHTLTVSGADTTSKAYEGAAWLGGVGRTGAVVTDEGSAIVAYDLNSNAADDLKSNTSPVLTNANIAETDSHTLFLNPFMEMDYARGNAEKSKSNNDADLFEDDKMDNVADILGADSARIGTLTDAQLAHHKYDWTAGEVKYKATETTYGALAYPCTDVCSDYVSNTSEHPNSFNCEGTYVYAPLVGIGFDANLPEGVDYDVLANMPENQTDIAYNGTGTAPSTNPTLEGYAFVGWTSDEEGKEPFDFDTQLTDNWTTLYAQWASMDEALTVKPANITIYVGGDGYEGVVDDSGVDATENSMPTPLFYVTLPDGVEVGDVESEVVLTGNNGREWRFEYAGNDANGNALYYINATGSVGGQGQDPVRVTYSIGNEIYVSDEFNPTDVEEMFRDYTVAIYSGAATNVTATIDSRIYAVVTETGTLRVRAVDDTENNNNPVTTITTSVEERVESGAAAITAPSDAKYTLNDTTVEVNPAGVGLLFDGIIDDSEHDRTGALIDELESDFNITVREGYYQAQYLDLVDANNGNAWVKADQAVTVYWGYPEGTGRYTDFTLYHFEGLHRDGENSGFDIADVETVNIEEVDIELGEYGITFDVGTGGFSPFVLVWDTDGGDEPVIPPVRPTDPVRPQEPDGLNTEDHVAYIIGYPDGEVKPEGNITRAEVATIFFRLLTDETREEYWSQTNGYTDVARDAWYNNAISTLSNLGIIDGYEDGSFRPNSPITRAEFTKIAVSFFEYADIEYEGTFSDVAEGRWYTQFVAAAVEMGLIEGYPDGTFRPDASITRAEACTIVNRTLGRAPHEDHLLPEEEMITWPDNLYGAWYYADMQEATNSHDYEWTTEDSERVEDWTEKLPERDWDALEEIWSEANDAPGGEVIG